MNLCIEASRSRLYTYPQTPVETLSDTEMAKQKFIPIQRGKLRSNDRKHYYVIFLWATQSDYENAVKIKSGTIAMCVTDSWIDEDNGDVKVNPKLGELHFVSGTWNVNAVAHECQHAVLHRLRYLDPSPELVLNENSPLHDPEDEEVIAYEAGAWVEGVLTWLTNIDPASPYPKNIFNR